VDGVSLNHRVKVTVVAVVDTGAVVLVVLLAAISLKLLVVDQVTLVHHMDLLL
tara:strand:- start:83 stop:241 length:159 start_codon:yes stop_codon:yes gene_type:complete